MFANLISHARAQAQHTAGVAAIGLGAGIALCVGLAFWTVAIWFLVLAVAGPVTAALIIGALYTGAGLIGLSIASTRARKNISPPKPVEEPPAPDMDGLIGAFITGLKAGARARR